MQVERIEVEVGETRNHPYEYGNRRCSVRLVASVEADSIDQIDAEIRQLRINAAKAVESELGEWVRILKVTRELDIGLNQSWEWREAARDGTLEDFAYAFLEKTTMLPNELADYYITEIINRKDLLSGADEKKLIGEVEMECKCGWIGTVDCCIPDVDGEGSLGCPECERVAKEV